MGWMLAAALAGVAGLGAARAGELRLPDIDAPLRTGERAPDDAAVVLGIQDYGFVMDVDYASRDAQVFHDWLVYTRGVPAERVELLDGAGREKILAAVDRAATAAGADDGALWLYFSGHGAAHPSTGERLLLGDDVKLDPEVFAARGVGVDELEALARSRGADRVLLVLDTCYTGLGRFAVPAGRAPTEITLWSATSGDQLAIPLEEVRHGAFTYFTVGALRGWADGAIDGAADGAVTMAEAEVYVGRALKAAQLHAQTPRLEGDAAGWVLASGRALERGPDLGAIAPASAQDYLEQLKKKIAEMEDLAANEAQREAERARRVEGAIAQHQGEAAAAWALLQPVIERGGEVAIAELEGFITRYRDAEILVDGTAYAVEIGEVWLAQGQLKAMRQGARPSNRVAAWAIDGGLLLTGVALSAAGRYREGQVQSTLESGGSYAQGPSSKYWQVNGLYVGGYITLTAGLALGVGLLTTSPPAPGAADAAGGWR